MFQSIECQTFIEGEQINLLRVTMIRNWRLVKAYVRYLFGNQRFVDLY
jgi:hypothetical protein